MPRLTGVAPLVLVGATLIVPPAGAVSTQGAAPTLETSGDTGLTPPAGALTFGLPDELTPAVAALALASEAPTVSASSAPTLVPDPAALALTGLAPTVQRASRVSPPAGTVVALGGAPDVYGVGRSLRTRRRGALIQSRKRRRPQ